MGMTLSNKQRTWVGVIIGVSVYAWLMYLAVTSTKRYLGPCIDGSKKEWAARAGN